MVGRRRYRQGRGRRGGIGRRRYTQGRGKNLRVSYEKALNLEKDTFYPTLKKLARTHY